MKKHIQLLAFALLAVSCGGRSLPGATEAGNARMASVIALTGDTTEIYATDYFPAFPVDSVTVSAAGVAVNPGETGWERFRIVATPAQAPALFTLDFWNGGRPLTVVAVDRRRQPAVPGMAWVEASDEKSVTVAFDRTPGTIVALWQNTPLPAKFLKSGEGRVTVTVPKKIDSLPRSFLRVYASAGDTLFNDVLIPLHHGKPVRAAEELDRRDRHAQVMYSLMVDRFVEGNPDNTRKLNSPDVLPKVDYYGGDLAGITQKIEAGYFTDLGVNTIWISPIVRNPDDAWGQYPDPKTRFSGYHGYWPLNNTVIDPRFGTADELRTLLDQAHRSDINVILDYVSNHLHINNPTFVAHPDWATQLELPDGRLNLELWDEYRLTTWFDRHIPSLDLERADVYEPMTDSAAYWMTRFDFDGFRHDATKHIPEIFWRTLTRKLTERLPEREFYQIGETYGSPELISSYVRTGMLDAQFDFNVYDAAIWNIVPPEGTMEQVARTVQASLTTYGYHNLMGYITGNHDRPRFISLAGGAVDMYEDQKLAGWKREIGVGDSIGYRRLALLEALMLTLPGVPCIYQGDEFGQPGANDPDNRRMMQFGDELTSREKEQYATVKALVHLRRTSMPLIYGTYIPLYADKDVMAYARTYGGETVVVALNKSDAARRIEVTLPSSLAAGPLRITIEPVSFEIEKVNQSYNIP